MMVVPLDWIAAGATLATSELVARRRWQGFVLGAVNGVLWAYLMYRAQLWGLLALEVPLVAQFLWAAWRWRRAALKKTLDVLPVGWYES